MTDSAGPDVFTAAALARHLGRVIAAPTAADAGAHAALEAAVTAARGCTLCAPHLPRGPRPVLRAGASARILIVGQAPGTKVHETGLPWNDASGDRLRDWTGLDREVFYDPARIAIIPMGFCYPGRGTGGDLPPRPECAPAWHPRLLPHLPELRLVILAGAYAIGAYARPLLGPAFARAPLSDVVAAWETLPPGIMPLPHPSPRNRRWLRDRPWFEDRVVPALKQRVDHALGR